MNRRVVDFFRVIVNEKKDGTLQIRPDWVVGRSSDLLTRNGSFYAVWDEEAKLWSQDIYDVQRLVDQHLEKYAKDAAEKLGVSYHISRLQNNSSKLWNEFQNFIRNSGFNNHPLDEKLVFANTEVKKEDYASRRLPYSLNPGPHDAWDTLIGTLYSEEERAKIEWAIGAVVSGDSRFIQKFLVFYGPPGSGKSTILNIIEKLFEGYTAVFDARELAGNNNSFATSAFKSNPLVAIQHDGDLSRIYDNTKLNSIVAHEKMTINEKYRTPFEARSNAFLFMGTNLPVKISDAKAGIIRRLIDVHPTGQLIEHERYHHLMDQALNFELGAIAQHCLDRYLQMGKNYYSNYRPVDMMMQTDVFYNFVEHYFDIFKEEDGVTLRKAWDLYKQYCTETGIDKILPQYKFREELKNYFFEFEDRTRINGQNVRSYYKGFKHLSTLAPEIATKVDGEYKIVLEEQPSIFDQLYPGQPAQYAGETGSPTQSWVNVTTTLSDIDTHKLHYVKVPESHIVIDFDLTDESGEKSLKANLLAASRFPATYTEVSKSGSGIHLHYIYNGDPKELASLYDVGIEIKTLLGNSALRRQLTKCNNHAVTVIDSGLPKREKPVLTDKSIKSERGLRELIGRNLRKEIHAGTRPSIMFIHKILGDAYNDGLAYDVTDLRSPILTFAMRSTNHSEECIKLVQTMKFVGQHEMEQVEGNPDLLVFFDVEVYPNLFIVCWKRQGSDIVVRMINPTPADIEPLFKMNLVGFNNRRYDNHVLWARYLGYTNEDLYKWSARVTSKESTQDLMFGEAYNLSYTDIYDFSSKKQGLKQFMIDLKIFHVELDIPWDEPVPEDKWKMVEEYCVNDVIATEAVFESRKQDFVARQILASLSGLSVNHTTQNHTAKIIFGENKQPQNSFVYTDLSEMFPGYKYDMGKSTYRGEETGEGGYVYAEPGIYENVALLDVASMHPTSIINLNLFGPYTPKFKDLLDARLAIKRKDYDAAASMLDGKLEPFLTTPHEGYDIKAAEDLAYALKIVINIVYGLTSARFNNPFRDFRNKDNIVAKRGALFMIDLKHAVQERGFTVAHIKTDSIKIPKATQEIIDFVVEFGKRYGYDFEHETTYDKFCLINDAVYIARAGKKWTAVGAQFQHPYVFKTLFSDEVPAFDDFCEAKNVVGATMYLDFSESGDISQMVHVGRTGSFVPVETNGGDLWRAKDGKLHAVTGTKGYKWITRDMAASRMADDVLEINMKYFDDLVDKAIQAIEKYTDDIKSFIS
jgi:hypothetical protein